jgi:hypothetical protein
MTKRKLTQAEQKTLARRNWVTLGKLVGGMAVIFNIAAGAFTALSPNPAQNSARYSQMLEDYCPFVFGTPKPSALHPVLAATTCNISRLMYFGVKIGGLAPAKAAPQLSLDFPGKNP